MKRYGNLWTELTSYSNLLRSAKQAQKSKRFRENVLDFNSHLESQLDRFFSSPFAPQPPNSGGL